VAEAVDVPAASLTGAASLLLAAILPHHVKLPVGGADSVPSNHWPETLTAAPIEYDRGPVLILIEYRVPQENRAPFLHMLTRLSHKRRRGGAYSGALPRTPQTRGEWRSGSWSNPGPSICASTGASRMPMPTCRVPCCAFMQGLPYRHFLGLGKGRT
jgi:hypothetical protein